MEKLLTKVQEILYNNPSVAMYCAADGIFLPRKSRGNKLPVFAKFAKTDHGFDQRRNRPKTDTTKPTTATQCAAVEYFI
ncbi:MAG: hypothetical protein ACOX7K_08430 [Oscillospiraceae bacterium]